MMRPCSEIGRLVASDEILEASWLIRLETRFHVFMCKHCKAYADQLRRLGQAARVLFSAPPNTEEQESINRLRDKLFSELAADSTDETEDRL